MNRFLIKKNDNKPLNIDISIWNRIISRILNCQSINGEKYPNGLRYYINEIIAENISENPIQKQQVILLISKLSELKCKFLKTTKFFKRENEQTADDHSIFYILVDEESERHRLESKTITNTKQPFIEKEKIRFFLFFIFLFLIWTLFFLILLIFHLKEETTINIISSWHRI